MLCRTFDASKSGYYDWVKRLGAPHKHEKVIDRIKALHAGKERVYGSRRIRIKLMQEDIRHSRKLVIELMKAAGVSVKRKKRFKKTTESEHCFQVVPNVLNRKFEMQKPNQCWVSDITYIRTSEGWLFLVVFIDLFSRKVVGWSMANSLESKFVVDAFRMACANRGSPEMIHSDRGIQYAAETFVAEVSKHPGCIRSMSRKSNCYDNAVAESFFNTLKVELLFSDRIRTKEETKLIVFEFIEAFYNQRRLHSSLNYLSPSEFEESQWVAVS